MKSIKNIMRMFKSWDVETLEGMRYGMFGFLLVDIFGVYWFLKLKRLGIALFLVAILFLTIILLLERRLNNMEQTESPTIEEEEEKKDKPKDKEEDESLNFGLPSSEEYNKRLKEAVGDDFF